MAIHDWYKAMVVQLNPDDNEAEQRVRMALERRSKRDLQRALNDLQDTLYPEGYSEWADATQASVRAHEQFMNDQALRNSVSRMLHDGADLGVSVAVRQMDNIGFGFDYTLANVAARDWAARHTDDLLLQLADTTEQGVGQAVARWIESAEPLQALIDTLTPFFGAARAENIASTEVTRAYAEGNKQAWRESGVVAEVEWRTAQDELVCPICGPLSEKRRRLNNSIDGNEPFDVGVTSPPAHPRCRCWLVPVIDN